MSPPTPVDVVVIGAGIVGASLAYHLARAGAAVTLMEAALPASGATADSFAWIRRGSSGAPPEQRHLRRHALTDWHRLEEEVDGVAVRWSGSLCWDDGEGAGADSQAATGLDDGHVIDATALTRLEPHLRTPPARAEQRPGDGAIDPVAVTHALVAAARRHGATVCTRTTVHHVAVRDQHVMGVHTTAGFQAAGTVVLANGTGAAALCAPLGFTLPVAPSPALLTRLRAAPGVVRTLVSNDRVEARQDADGDLLAPWDWQGQTTPEQLQRAGQRTLADLQATFTGLQDAVLTSVRIGQRPMPADGSPILGPIPDVSGTYLAVMHSGVTLAATVGRLATDEIIHRANAEELQPLRPSRFTH